MSRKVEVQPGPSPQSGSDRCRSDRSRSLETARRWVALVDRYQRAGQLEHVRSVLVEACWTCMLLGDASDHWGVLRVVEAYEAAGRPTGARAHAMWPPKLLAVKKPKLDIGAKPLGEQMQIDFTERGERWDWSNRRSHEALHALQAVEAADRPSRGSRT